MRIAIDLLVVENMGTINYTNGFLPALGQIANKDDEFLVFVSPDVADMVRPHITDNIQLLSVETNHNLIRRIYWEQIKMPRYLRHWKADVLFAPFDIAPIMSKCPVLLAVRTPGPALLNNRYGWLSTRGKLKAIIHKTISNISCRKAYKIFYPTKYASNLLGDIMGVPYAKREVVYHGTDYSYWNTKKNPKQVLDKYNIESNCYVLFVSNFYNYKRVDVLIDGYSKWSNNTKRKKYKLVLVGEPPSDVVEKALYGQIRDLNLDGNTIILKKIPRSDLAILYQEATVFVLPSTMETFGQPFVEAMASGVPVICADTEFARELCGEAALYFKIDNTDELVRVLTNVIEWPELRERKRVEGYLRAKIFSWDREARETLLLLKKSSNGFN